MTQSAKRAVSPLIQKLESAESRYQSLQESLQDPTVLANAPRLIALSKESGQLQPLVERYRQYRKAVEGVEELNVLATGADAEMAEMARADIGEAKAKADRMLEGLKDEMLAAEEAPVESFFLEIRAGTGGEEAALFGRDLFEMYRRYCEVKRWVFDVSDFSTSERGGFKEVIVNIRAKGAYRRLRFEGGGHRVQRVPETEAQGRIHTSAATVAVLPEMPDVKIEINPREVEEQGCRGGGPGGQNVNKVETGWRILHKPSGLQFKMTEHKSQSQNKERAWALLRAALYDREQAKQHAAVTSARKAMMGSGDRSQRIRTYNFPQNRCTDHRLGGEEGGEKNFALDKVMAGDLDPVIDALLELDRQQRLASL
jgi:peptide chain release factor 1